MNEPRSQTQLITPATELEPFSPWPPASQFAVTWVMVALGSAWAAAKANRATWPGCEPAPSSHSQVSPRSDSSSA
jgi:hypothetical protein